MEQTDLLLREAREMIEERRKMLEAAEIAKQAARDHELAMEQLALDLEEVCTFVGAVSVGVGGSSNGREALHKEGNRRRYLSIIFACIVYFSRGSPSHSMSSLSLCTVLIGA